VSAALWIGGSGDSASAPSLRDAVDRTAHEVSGRYAFAVGIVRATQGVVLHVQGAQSPGRLVLHTRVDRVLAGGATFPGETNATVRDGRYLYERIPRALGGGGPVRWVRVDAARLPSSSGPLAGIHALTTAPLLRLLRTAKTSAVGARDRVFRGSLSYDDPVVRAVLAPLTGGIEFRDLGVRATVGADGRVHAVRLTGRTADGGRRLLLAARLFAFGRAVHVTPPPAASIVDRELAGLSA